MQLDPTPEQAALTEAVSSLCADHFNPEKLHAFSDADSLKGDSFQKSWRALAEMGLFSLVLPEEEGGVGLGYAEAVLAFETLGRFAVPGPVLGTFLAAGLVEGAASGEVKVGIVQNSEPPVFVENFELLDELLVLDGDKLWQAKIGELEYLNPEEEIPLDPLTSVARLKTPLEKTTSQKPLAEGETVSRISSVGAVLTAAFQLGIAAAATDISLEYAQERQQFGVSIGSFQSIKHLLADMLTQVEVSRAAVYTAGICLDDPQAGDLNTEVSTARITASEAGGHCAMDCVQIHGGMGFTWEADPHLYLKRSWVLDTVFGSAEEHALKLGASLVGRK